ncbi:MAG: DEAD/DEAH box helicase [Desulfobulbaceae bacterium]|jgi:ATP-dependent RNA helicase RhlB|nr:DEAD/DEAH box helicase [Desulfobulbaceae bacterium]
MRSKNVRRPSVPDKNGKKTTENGSVFGLPVVKLSVSTPTPAKQERSARPAKPARQERPDRPAKPSRPKKTAQQQPVKVQNLLKDRKDNGNWQTSEHFIIEPQKGRVRFHDFNLPDTIMHGIHELSFQYCTPIQGEILEQTLQGRDATGKAQTGTGKSAAFLLQIMANLLAKPLENRKKGTPRCLIIAPTRELVIQIAEDAEALAKYTDITIVPVYGGMDYQKQEAQVCGNYLDIVVATPGRLLDFKRKQHIMLGQVEIFVIDEADRMLDMGFIPDVRQIVYALPGNTKRQTLFFSATMTPEVNMLAEQWTDKPAVVEIESKKITVDTVEQIVYLVTTEEKYPLLYNLIQSKDLHKLIVFCNRKAETRKLTELMKAHNIECDMLSGDVDQKKRMTTLNNFKAGKIRVLIATDVAGRGIHVDGVSHVVNYNLPYDPEDYVHRIGRTGRAGTWGTSISFACEEDAFYLPDIETFIKPEFV